MSIKYKNSKGLNERKSNQGSLNIHLDDMQVEDDEKRFTGKDQDYIESHSGEQWETSGDSFDKYPKQ